MYISTVSWTGVSESDICLDEIPGVANSRTREQVDLSSPDRPIAPGLLEGRESYRTIRPYGRSDWLLFLTVGGCGVIRSATTRVRAERHSAVLILDRVPHDYATARGESPWTFGYAHVSPRPFWRSWVQWPSRVDGILVLEIGDESTWRAAWNALADARRLLSSPARGRSELAYNALERCLLWCDEANPSRGPLADPRVRRAAEFAARNLTRPITVEAMSNEAGLSASRLNALFRTHLGVSPAQYAERLRLDHAARLLSSAGLSVKEAAAASGYADPFHFSRRFRARFGYPPSRQTDRTAGGA